MSKTGLSRRDFLKIAGISTAATVFIGGGGIVYGRFVESSWVQVKKVALRLPRLQPAFDGFRLAHISDIHMDGKGMTRDYLRTVCGLISDQKVDYVAITGDFVTRHAEDFVEDLNVELTSLAARLPVVAVLGNHDHWTNAGLVREMLKFSGVVNVSNGVLTLERDGDLLHLCGVDDVWEKQHRIDRVLAKLPAEGAAILLAHEPDYAAESAKFGRFDLQLSGHSHGGQVVIPAFGPPLLPSLGQVYPAGQYQVGEMIQYTNRGIGTIEPRVRINCRPEVTIFTLHSSA